MKRRDILTGSLAAAAGAALLPRVADAQIVLPAFPSDIGERGRKLVAIAREQMARHGDGLWARDVVGITDFGLRSDQPRLHLVDLERGTLDSYRCAHGMGSDPEHDGWLNWFSNIQESLCSSKGAYMTFGWYTGQFGTSIRLEGRDPTNSNALDRAIVMHRARYCEPEHVAKYGRLGRSNGCFAMSDAEFKIALLRLAGGRLLYADKLGIGAGGEAVIEPPKDLRLLVPEGTPQPGTAPGVY